VEILGNDEEIVLRLVEEGLIMDRPDGFARRDIERALVTRTLVRELDVNWAGVEVILLMREQLRATHLQVAEMLSALRASSRSKG
jgi:hypothetical protein